MLRIFCLVALFIPPAMATTSPQVESSVAHHEACAALLAVDAPDESLTATVSRELTEMLAFQRSDLTFIDRLREVTNDLVAKNRITPEQAEHQFSARVLGQFAPIFMKFVVAELRVRQYDERDVVNFILHFEDAYTPEVQVEFAFAVTRRMLMSINDVPPTTNPEGLAQFMAATKGFGVSSKEYGQFLQIWAKVRGAHPRTVVHFILANIQNAGHRLSVDVEEQRRVEDENRPTPRWYQVSWWSGDNKTAPRSDHERAVARLNGLEVPAFIVSVEDLVPRESNDLTTFERFLDEDSGDDFAAYLERLSVRPPFIWDHVLRGHLPTLNPAQTRSLLRWSGLPRVDRGLVDQARADESRFAKMEILADKIRAEHAELAARAGRLTLGRGDPSFKTINKFIDVFSLTFIDESSRRPMDEAVTAAISETFLSLRRQNMRIHDAEFLPIVRRLVEMTFASTKAPVAAAAMRSLVMASREFDVKPGEARDLLDLVRLHVLKDNAGAVVGVETLHGAELYMDPDRWGQRHVEPEIVPPPSALPQLLAEFRSLLTESESSRLSDEQLLSRLEVEEIPESPPLLLWNSGTVN